MNQCNLFSLSGDPTLPDLVPEAPVFEDLLQFNDWTIPSPCPDIVELTRKLDSLTLESNTQSLRLEIERAKRQRLQASIRQIKRDVITMSPEIIEIRNDLRQFKEFQNATNYQLDGENVRTNTLVFRSLSRTCEMFATMIPSATLSPEASYEANILLQELTTTIKHFGVHYATSYA